MFTTGPLWAGNTNVNPLGLKTYVGYFDSSHPLIHPLTHPFQVLSNSGWLQPFPDHMKLGS